jgi:hypothetical protein
MQGPKVVHIIQGLFASILIAPTKLMHLRARNGRQ